MCVCVCVCMLACPSVCTACTLNVRNPLPSCVSSKVLFDLLAYGKSVQDGDRALSLHLVHNEAIVVDGGGLFLREHSQETPSSLLSFLLLSLAAPACSLLSFLISMAGAACTPSRHNSSFSGPHSRHASFFQGQPPHITFIQKQRSDSRNIGLSAITFDPAPFVNESNTLYLLVRAPYNCS